MVKANSNIHVVSPYSDKELIKHFYFLTSLETHQLVFFYFLNLFIFQSVII